ncbi:MAG: UvrD-helicase domain-containing protein [Chloroflexota bacterium]
MDLDVLDGLNPVQAQAVRAVDGPVLVLAGPGSGKTRVLTHRIAYLTRVGNAPPYSILAVTFTNKAANEMKVRLQGLIGSDLADLTVGTFHAICVRILRRDGAHLGLDRNFGIYDEDDQQRLITRILKDLNLDTKMYSPTAVRGAISRAKNEMITPQDYRPPTYWHEAVARAYEAYEARKTESNVLDFDDLLVFAERLFREHEDVRARYQRRYRYVLVDEFQDTNRVQYDLVKHLANEQSNLFVVGDEDQSIYSWRGADFRNVLRFRSDFPSARVFVLEQNYRSTQTILDAAHAVIAHNAQRTEKKLWTRNPVGGPIRVFEAYDEREEADYVVGELQRLVARGTCRLGECAIMFRTNAQSRALEDALMHQGLPYKLVGAIRFYQRREIKDALAYLSVLLNCNDEVSLERIINVPARGIGPKTIAQLRTWASESGRSSGAALLALAEQARAHGDLGAAPFGARAARPLLSLGEALLDLRAAIAASTLAQLMQALLDRIGYLDALRDGTEEGEDRIANVKELLTAAARYDSLPATASLPSFLEEVALVADVDQVDWQADAVTLLTLHSAKGLEFDTVFIIGMEEGICPHSRSMDNPDQMEEERRLCYVGLTRAKNRLYLLRTFRRTFYGSSEVRDPSRFLLDIPPKLLEGHMVRATTRPATPSAPARARDGRDLFRERRAAVEQRMGQLRERDPRPDAERRPPGATAPVDGGRERRAPAEPSPAAREPSFHVGEAVRHPLFGSGIVISCKVSGDDDEVTVAFEGQGLKRLMASYARLERV